jgi:hypothetical protein
MFLSWKRSAQASAPPVRDDFRDVFQGRLVARLASRNRVVKGADSRLGPGKGMINRVQPKKEALRFQATSGSSDPHQVSGAKERNRRDEAHRTRKQAESQAAIPGLAADHRQSVSSSGQNNQGAASASPPPALQDLMTFLQSQPNGALKIPPEQVPAVAAYLVAAGLPHEEVEGLLSSRGFSEQGLSAADLQAAWQRTQGQGASAETLAEPKPRPQQSLAGLNLSPEAQEMLQTPDYRAHWQRLTVSEDMLPILRLALARLGSSPQALARLEEEAQGHGLPLSRVWQILQQGQNRGIVPAANEPSPPSPGENPSPAAMLAARPVTAEEVAEWRQLLLKAGLQPEMVEKMLGQASPATQGDLKATLLALAPPEEPATVLSEPKPLYLPENLRQSPFFQPDQTDGGQSHRFGQGSGDQQPGAAANLASDLAEAFGLPAFSTELSSFTPLGTGLGAPLSAAGPLWNPIAPEVRGSLWSQLQSAIFSNLQPGESRVSLNLNPPEMGHIQLNLHLSGQELAVTAVASRPDVAELATQGVQQLLQALAQQGLVLTQFQVRLQDHPQGLTAAAQAGGREKPGESGERFPAANRRRRGEVDRFV